MPFPGMELERGAARKSGRPGRNHLVTARRPEGVFSIEDASMAAANGSAPGRIGVFGNFGSGNLGNDGTFEAMLEFLQEARPADDIVCLCADADRVSDTYGIAALPHHWPRPDSSAYRIFNKSLLKLPGKFADMAHSFAQTRRFDVIIMPGTGLFDGISERTSSMPFTLFRTCLAARFWGTKIWVVNVGAAGPIKDPICRWFLRYAARTAEYRTYRDQHSKELVNSIGFDTSGNSVYPDLVFKLDPPSPLPARTNRRRTVGVGVMAYKGMGVPAEQGRAIYEAYIGKITAFVGWLLDEDYDVRLLIGEDVDQEAVDDILAGLRDENGHRPVEDRIVSEQASSLHDLMRQLATVDFVVATRFHNVICALKLGKPVLSVGYQKKFELLMDRFGLVDFCQDVEDLDVEKLRSQFGQLSSNASEIEKSIREKVDEYMRSLEQQERILTGKLLETVG